MRRLAVLLLGACAGDVPADPTWVDDVYPILAANCARCHREHAIGGAPTSFRLDIYEDTTRGIQTIRGARAMAEFVAARADDQPPVGPGLDGRQKDILRNWVANRRLGERPGNHAPRATLRNTLGTVDQQASLDILVSDTDGDPVMGSVMFGAFSDIASLHDGVNIITWDTGVVPPGNYSLQALLSDGIGGTATVTLGSVTIEHANTAPTVVFLNVFADDLIADRQSPFLVRFNVVDPDGGPLTLRLEAFHGTETVVIDPSSTVDPGLNTFDWDTTDAPEGTTWRLRATITDPDSASRTFVSPQFIVSHSTSADTYADVSDILTGVCSQCHNNVKVEATDFSTYADIEALRGRAWRKLVQLREMPPVSLPLVVPGARLITEEERTRLGAWLFAGAPP